MIAPGLKLRRVAEEIESEGSAEWTVEKNIADLFTDVYGTAEAYFGQSASVKLHDQLAGGYGYRPFAAEYSQSPERLDPFESFTAGEATREASFELSLANELNVGMVKLFEELCDLASRILAGFADRYRVDEDTIAQFAQGCRAFSCLQLNYSEPSEVEEDYIHEEHEDGHILSFVSTTGPGLEIKTGGQFISVTPIPPRLIIMPGDILSLLTGGNVRPLYHRVRAVRSLQRRYALVHFVDPDPRTCVPWNVTEMNRDVSIGERVLANPARFGLERLRPPV